MERKKDKTWLLFLIAGAIFIAAGVILSVRTAKFNKNGVSVQAEIVRIERDDDSGEDDGYAVYVKYTAEGRQYTSRLDFYSFRMRVGDKITILYLPENPQTITYAKSYKFTPVCFVVGIVVLCFAIKNVCKKGDKNAAE